MLKATLTRTKTDDDGTFGTLSIDGLSFVTGELPDRDNAPMISCIPPGTYRCEWSPSAHLGRDVYHLQNVPGRSSILIHPANLMGATDKGLKAELNGCIALGRDLCTMHGQCAVGDSRDAVAEFEEHLNGEPFDLEIVDQY